MHREGHVFKGGGLLIAAALEVSLEELAESGVSRDLGRDDVES